MDKKVVMCGIDISQWNVVTDFNKVKAAGYEFVIVRLVGCKTYKYHDSKGLEHLQRAKEAGLHVGAYCYVNPDKIGYNGLDDALYFLNYIPDSIHLDMPVYLDVEGWNKNRIANTEYVIDLMETLENRGFFAGIYGSDISTFKDLLLRDKLTPYSWWVARYGNEPTYATQNLHMWQHKSTGQVPGIVGNVDLNYCYIDFPKIIESKHLNIRR